MYDKSCIINSPPSPLPLPSSHVASKARGKRGHWTPPPPPHPPPMLGIEFKIKWPLTLWLHLGWGVGLGGGTELSYSNGFHLTNQKCKGIYKYSKQFLHWAVCPPILQ
jgi:hypothetical protein